MKALIGAALIAASPFTAHSDPITYKGMTLGMPLPDTIAPDRSILLVDQMTQTDVPVAFQALCEHRITADGGPLLVLTDTCDGPVVSISASDVTTFFNPDDVTPTDPRPELADFEYGITTLAQVRGRFCSEGLIVEDWLGQTSGIGFGGLALGYEVEDTDAIAIFGFQLARSDMLFPPLGDTPMDASKRSATTLLTIELMTRGHLDTFLSVIPNGDQMTTSNGYQPIVNVFNDPALTMDNCQTS